MADIQTSIQIYDRATAPLNNIVTALQSAVGAFQSVSSVMDSGMDTSSIEQARIATEEAARAVNDLSMAFSQVEAPSISVNPVISDIPEIETPDVPDLTVNITPVLDNMPSMDVPDVPVELIPEMDTSSIPTPDPVQVPVTWQADSFEVFTTTGVERFEQELSSANQMMTNLLVNQRNVNAASSAMDILPDGAAEEIQSVYMRMLELSSKIRELSNTPVSMQTDTVNNQIEELRAQLDMAVDAQNQLNDAIDRMDVSGANAAYLQLSQTVSNTERYIRDNTNEQGLFNSAIEQGVGNASQLQGMLSKAAGVLGTFFGIRQIFNFATKGMDNLNTKLNSETQLMTVLANMIEDDYILQVMAEADTTAAVDEINSIQDQITDTVVITAEAKTNAVQKQFDAISAKAEEIESKGIYGGEMMAGTAELATYFTDTDALTMMMDTLADYAMGMSGGGALDSAAMTEYATGLGKIMTGAYDSMTKKGFEFTDAQKAVIEGTATEAEYAEVLGDQYVNMSDDMRAATAITQVIDESWAGLYETMSNTPEGKIIQLQNSFDALSESLAAQLYPYIILIVDTVMSNWPVIEGAIGAMGNAIGIVISIIGSLIQGIISVAGFFQSNWSVISPIIMGIVTALGLLAAAWVVVSTAQAIHNGVTQVTAAAEAMAAGQTFLWTVQQYGLNAALAACPISWIILMIIALIAVIFAVCNAIAKMTGIANTGFGIITGCINVTIQFFWNLLKVVGNVMAGIANAIAAVASNMITAFHNAISKVEAFFYDLLSTAASVISNIAEALNQLPFVEFDFSGIKSAASSYAAKSAAAAGDVEDYTSVVDAFTAGLDTFDAFETGWAAEAFSSGASWGDGMMSKLDSMLDGLTLPEYEMPEYSAGSMADYTYDPSSLGGGYDSGGYDASQIPSNIADTAGNTAATADSLEITDEDLKYLRDIAERDVINRFTTAEIKVEWNNTQNINSELDLDGVVDYLATGIQDAMEVAAEGVHA